jgi:hypothetical protein
MSTTVEIVEKALANGSGGASSAEPMNPCGPPSLTAVEPAKRPTSSGNGRFPEPIPARRTRKLRFPREPLLQFLLFGAAIFVVAQVAAHYKRTARTEIVVDDGVVQRLRKLCELQMGTPPSPAQLNTAIAGYVHDEVLYREALRMGLAQDDEIIRRRLIQKADFLLNDLTAVPEPAEAALKDYYAAHSEQFVTPAKVTFRHLYFSFDHGGAEEARIRAERAQRELHGQETRNVSRLADHFPLNDNYSTLSPMEVAQIFGDTPIVSALFSAPVGEWAGPVSSGYGLHLALVEARIAEVLPPFDEVKLQVKEAYLRDAKETANRNKYEQLRARYRVAGGAVEITQ